MAFVYILQSQATNQFYIGAAADLEQRFSEHQRGQSPYTRSRGPWKLVYKEEYATVAEARRRERQLKSWKSHRSIQDLVSTKHG